MALQNIGAANRDDAFYRYKMPKMITKIEGRGNGIKTNVVNMVDIAKALARPASYTIKYFGCELGAQSKFDEKTGTALVNGAHETAKLAGLLENFIKKYVQCYGCGNPETEIIITKSQMITLKCAACGYISDVDMRDKLTTFILKNPPEQKKGSKDKKVMRRAEKERLKEGEAADEEEKKVKKELKKKGSSATTVSKASSGKKNSGRGSDEDLRASPPRNPAGDNEAAEEDDDDDDIQWQTDTSAEAARKRIQEQLSAVTAEMVMLTTTEPEQEKKPKEVTKSPVSRIKGELNKRSAPTELRSYIRSLAGFPQEDMAALFESLIGTLEKGFAKELMKKKNYLQGAMGGDGELQMILLQAAKAFCEKSNGVLANEVVMALKVLYDVDVLEEECIVKWYEEGLKGSTKGNAIWKSMKPFVEWLQEAESESEEEE
ncbi:Eukaryotic translation initiation factor 5 [Acorus gramineus]|uniref:Eukaryotic translation initiation factor 5 n=1 Tax=Acorus gramineus TaxID=55184 RepID=A0AAV9AWG3_ACOGR|nr:Eukaryotic translation initiation factor 5 [Acorus gramineus]